MLKVGITGNIGSGKSLVSRIFEVLGVPVFYADTEAKRVMTADAILINAIKETFGTPSYFDDGALNRKYIAGIVFNDEAELHKLNVIVHPAVFRAFDCWVKQHKNVAYVLKEAALLFESGSYKMCDKTILVTAPLDMRVKRVVQRDRLTEAEVLSRDLWQFSEEKKLKMAGYMIRNDNSELVIPQVLALHEKFRLMAHSS